MKKILIIEDEIELVKSLSSFLKNEGFAVVSAEDGDKGIDKFYDEKPDLIVLDINLPKKNGWEVCKLVKQNSNIPVIMMTARDTELDELQGLDLGADDYLTKPVSLKILVARIRRILKIDNNSLFQMGNMSFDFKSQQLIIDGVSQEISGRESQLLEYFIRNRGIVLTRDKVLNEIWGFDFYGDDRVVDTLVKRTRKKLGPYADFIKTVRGMGYLFDEN